MTAKVSDKEFLEVFIKESKCSFSECTYSCPVYELCRLSWSRREEIDISISYIREEAIKQYLMLYGEAALFEVLL